MIIAYKHLAYMFAEDKNISFELNDKKTVKFIYIRT